jgi:hypothetical protein
MRASWRAGPIGRGTKAADGKRLHKLDTDPEAMPVAQRIYAEVVASSGIYAIAEGLIDVEDVALGHTTKLRWNDQGK